MSSSDTQTIEEDETEREEGDVLPEDEQMEEPTTDQAEPGAHEQRPAQAPDFYTPSQCTLHFTITMLPSDGNQEGRPVLVGARTDNDDPIVLLTHADELADLTPTLQELYERLVAELPERKASTQKRIAAQPRRQEKTTKEQAQTKRSTLAQESTTSAEQAKASTQVKTLPIPASKPSEPGRKQSSRRGTTADTEKQTEQMTLF